MQTGNNDFQKRANMALVMETILKSEEISRAELSRKLGLIRSTVSNLVQELLNLDVVEERSLSDSTGKGGRKAILLGIKGKTGAVAGVEIIRREYRLVIVDLTGEVLVRDDQVFDSDELSFATLFSHVADKIEEHIEKLGVKLIGVSLGLPGVIDARSGIIINSGEHQLKDFNFVDRFASRFDVPVLIENDARSCAWGELWKTNSSELNTFCYFFLRTKNPYYDCGAGIGLGVVVDGKIHYGAHYLSGEIARANRRRINERYIELFSLLNDESISLEQIKEDFVDVRDDFFNIISLLDPAKIILGDELQQYTDLFQQLFSEEFGADDPEAKRLGLIPTIKDCDIVPTTLGKFEVPLGAAFYFLKKLYSIPQVGKQQGYAKITWGDLF